MVWRVKHLGKDLFSICQSRRKQKSSKNLGEMGKHLKGLEQEDKRTGLLHCSSTSVAAHPELSETAQMASEMGVLHCLCLDQARSESPSLL